LCQDRLSGFSPGAIIPRHDFHRLTTKLCKAVFALDRLYTSIAVEPKKFDRFRGKETGSKIRREKMAKYEAGFTFTLDQRSNGNSINAFSVVGGTLGKIDLGSTSDADIELGLQQAKKNQSITLFTPSTNMMVLADLMHLLVIGVVANKSERLSLKLERVSGSPGVYFAPFRMSSDNALIQNLQIVANGELMIQFRIGGVTINRTFSSASTGHHHHVRPHGYGYGRYGHDYGGYGYGHGGYGYDYGHHHSNHHGHHHSHHHGHGGR
jgi:hypothetical protein